MVGGVRSTRVVLTLRFGGSVWFGLFFRQRGPAARRRCFVFLLCFFLFGSADLNERGRWCGCVVVPAVLSCSGGGKPDSGSVDLDRPSDGVAWWNAICCLLHMFSCHVSVAVTTAGQVHLLGLPRHDFFCFHLACAPDLGRFMTAC